MAGPRENMSRIDWEQVKLDRLIKVMDKRSNDSQDRITGEQINQINNNNFAGDLNTSNQYRIDLEQEQHNRNDAYNFNQNEIKQARIDQERIGLKESGQAWFD